MSTISLDFETRSRVDLKKCGADVYASDPSTDILMCSFIDETTGAEWLWYAGDPLPGVVYDLLKKATTVKAHNARFDELIYEYIAVEDYGFPEIKKEVWYCTAAQCRVNALPASLDGATRASNSKHKKNHAGSVLIRKLCIPQKDSTFNDDPKLMKELGKYCMDDTRAMVSLSNGLRDMSIEENEDWHVNERINDRGVLIDLELAALAAKYAEEEKEVLGQQLSDMTSGKITKVTQTKRLLGMVIAAFGTDRAVMNCVTKPKKDPTAETKYTMDKAARGLLLELPDLPDYWRDLITLVDQGGNSSVSKFTAMMDRADPETGRVHGAFIFAGAGQTHRFSSKGLQLHNMRRDCWGEFETAKLKAIMRADRDISAQFTEGLNVMEILAKLLRKAIIAEEGKDFVTADWSSIEARVLPWLANSPGAEKVLDVFREGRDIYVETAEAMGGYERQIGKVAVLSLGYGGSNGAFNAMAKNYGLELSDSVVSNVVMRWRRDNHWALVFWKQLEAAALKAVRSPGTVFEAGRVKYVFAKDLLGGTLCCILPNNEVIQYPYARVERGGVTAMKASVQPKADSDDEWPRMRLWGGFQAENITQATAGALQRESLYDMDADGMPVVMHVHDDITCEVPIAEAQKVAEQMQTIMEACPDWATGLPLTAEPKIRRRYG